MHIVGKDLHLGHSGNTKDTGAKTLLTALLVLGVFESHYIIIGGKNKELCFAVKWIF